MRVHPALESSVTLQAIFVVYQPSQRAYDVIGTVGEALNYLIRLPAQMDGLHWALASNGLCWAHRDTEGVKHATEAFEMALLTDELAVAAYPVT